MNWKVTTPYEKLEPNCFGDKPRVYATKEEAEARAAVLNAEAYAFADKIHLAGTFSFKQTNDPV